MQVERKNENKKNDGMNAKNKEIRMKKRKERKTESKIRKNLIKLYEIQGRGRIVKIKMKNRKTTRKKQTNGRKKSQKIINPYLRYTKQLSSVPL